jgi:hypothetical protein
MLGRQLGNVKIDRQEGKNEKGGNIKREDDRAKRGLYTSELQAKPWISLATG